VLEGSEVATGAQHSKEALVLLDKHAEALAQLEGGSRFGGREERGGKWKG